MKKVIIAVFALVLVFGFKVSNAQSNKELKKEIKDKAVREARKEAKSFKKDGYYVAPGALPMAKQIEKAWMKQYEDDESGFPMYIVASGNSVAETQAAAKIQATELAKLELAGTISTQVAALIENSVANQQLNNEDAASVTKTIAASKSIIAQELGRIITLFEIYRKVDKNIETNVRIAYNSEMAKEAVKKVVRKKLEDETEIAHDKLEKLMNF
jgi:hypothetical protein